MNIAANVRSVASYVQGRPLLHVVTSAVGGAAAGALLLFYCWLTRTFVQPNPAVVLIVGAAMGVAWSILVGSLVRPLPHGRAWRVTVTVIGVCVSIAALTLLPYPESRAASATIWYAARGMGSWFGFLLVTSVWG